MTYDAGPEVFAISEVVARILIFFLEVTGINVRYLSTQLSSKPARGCRDEQLFFFLFRKFCVFIYAYFCVLSPCKYFWHIGIGTSLLNFDLI